MKTESELLGLYAQAYKARSIEGIKDYIPAIIQYSKPGENTQLMVKSNFLAYLQDKFEGQKIQVPLENVSIMLVDNETTKKENIYIDFGAADKYLFSIEINNGLYERIAISRFENNKFTRKKVFLEKSNRFNYLNSGVMMILEEDDPNEAIDVILNSNYPYESCIGENFEPDYIAKLIKGGFYAMSRYYHHNDRYILEAMHHLTRSVLFFDHLHIKKSIKRYLSQYELRENVKFETIIYKCIEHHNNAWLTEPLVESIKEIHRINSPAPQPSHKSGKGSPLDVTFISFGLYRDSKLIAGEFGTKVGRIYSSYSGFYEEGNSGTIQMVLTAQYLERNGYAFWDLGMPLDYKTTIGAKILNLENFISLWRKYSNQTVGLNMEYEKYPLPKQNLSEEQLLLKLRDTYRYFYTDDLQDYLVDDFHYASQHVFDEITTKHRYLEYLRGKLKTIQNSGSPNNKLLLEIVYDSYSNRPYLYMKQNENEALFVAEAKDGKFIRLDLCIPGLFSFIRKSETELSEQANK